MQVVRSVAPEAEGSASTSTASTSAKLGSHTTGVADSGRWSTRRIAMYALFVALAMVTSFKPPTDCAISAKMLRLTDTRGWRVCPASFQA